jgi:hypothetical protein
MLSTLECSGKRSAWSFSRRRNVATRKAASRVACVRTPDRF